MGHKQLFDHLNWNIGPGQRIGILGANGAGKTSLIRMLLGELHPTLGRVVTGVTVKPAYLSQHLEELDPTWRVLESVEHVAQRVDLGKGRELTAWPAAASGSASGRTASGLLLATCPAGNGDDSS